MALSAPVEAEPLTVLLPVHAPEAVQEVAFVELHVSVELPPLLTVMGLAVRLTVGAGGLIATVTACDAVPPEPVQASV